jgi:protein-S-isoprenylcysteine O-methyltransferase
LFDLRNVAIIIFVVWVAIDGIVVFRHRTGAAENRDKSSLKVIVIIGPLGWLGGIALSFTDIGSLHWPDLQVAGLALMAIGIVVRSTAIAQLGRFHTPNVAIRADHRLLDTGLYAYVRHPSYLGAIVAFLGLSFAMNNWLSIAAIMIVTPLIYLYRMHEEDAALLAAFGDSYRAYCQRTKRLIPWVY